MAVPTAGGPWTRGGAKRARALNLCMPSFAIWLWKRVSEHRVQRTLRLRNQRGSDSGARDTTTSASASLRLPRPSCGQRRVSTATTCGCHCPAPYPEAHNPGRGQQATLAPWTRALSCIPRDPRSEDCLGAPGQQWHVAAGNLGVGFVWLSIVTMPPFQLAAVSSTSTGSCCSGRIVTWRLRFMGSVPRAWQAASGERRGGQPA